MRVGRRGVAVVAACFGLFSGWVRAETASAPVIRTFSPSTASVEGGEEVTVAGSGFTPDVVVALGDAVATDVTVVDESQLRFRVPRQQAPGRRTLTIRTSAGMDQWPFRIVPKPLADLAPCEITTVAGGVDYVGDGFLGLSETILSPRRVAVDAARNTYVADPVNHRVRRIDGRTRAITTVAGCGRPGFDGDGALAVAAALDAPSGVAVDTAGNVFVADSAKHRVRRVDAATGRITTVAGTGEATFAGDGGPATAAALRSPGDLAIDAAGNLLVADAGNQRVRRIDAATGIITTVAGGGECDLYPGGQLGDGGPATDACVSPEGICLDAAGNLFVADPFAFRIRKVDAATGVVTSVAGDGDWDSTPEEGPATETSLYLPEDVVADDDGTLYLVDGQEAGGDVGAFGSVRKVDTSGYMSLVDVYTVGFATGLALDDVSNLYVADPDDGIVRVLSSSSGLLATLAGSGKTEPTPTNVGVRATEATFGFIADLAVDSDGDLYILEGGYFLSSYVLKVPAATGVGVVVAGTGTVSANSLALDRAGNVYTGEGDFFAPSLVRRVSAKNGQTKVLAGGGDREPKPGIAGHRVRLGSSTNVAADRGRVYVTSFSSPMLVLDAKTGRVLRVLSSSGFGPMAVSADGTVYLAAGTLLRLQEGEIVPVPIEGAYASDVAVARDGVLYTIAGNRVLRVDPRAGTVTTIAGGDAAGYSGDAGPAAAATFDWPIAIAVDGVGNVYVATLRGVVRAIRAGC
jgi:sugar lactone lactonase YvrE